MSRQPFTSVWLPGWLVDPLRRCSHDHQRGIYGDEAWTANARARCLNCGRLLDQLPERDRREGR